MYTVQCWEDRDSRKTMNKNNAKSLTTLRQKLKRYNRLFEDDIAHAKEVRLEKFWLVYTTILCLFTYTC